MTSPENAAQATQIPPKLSHCETFAQQKAWCREQLDLGRTLTDPEIWLGGGDPLSIIRALRREGMNIQTCHVRTTDAAGEAHPRTLAWRLLRPSE